MEKTIKTFKHLSKKGYKHYTENTTEELDELPLDNHHIITEFAHLCEWLRVNHGIWVETLHRGDMGDFIFKVVELDENNWKKHPHYIHNEGFNSPQEAYSAAFDYILNNLL
jgi:hypothetical protein